MIRRAVTVEMVFQTHDGPIPLLPKCFLFDQFCLYSLATKNFWTDANNKHIFVEERLKMPIRPRSGKRRCAPKKIMFKFLCGRLFETEDLTTLRIYPGHDVADGAVLAGRIHSLKNQLQRITVGGVVELLNALNSSTCPSKLYDNPAWICK